MKQILLLQEKTKLSKTSIENIIKLLEDGCTIPFIARYRKDFTNSATDEQLRTFEEIYEYSKKLENRKNEILEILKNRDFLNEDISKNLEDAQTLQVLEDIYSPLKDKV